MTIATATETFVDEQRRRDRQAYECAGIELEHYLRHASETERRRMLARTLRAVSESRL